MTALRVSDEEVSDREFEIESDGKVDAVRKSI